MIPHDPNRPQIDPRHLVCRGSERELYHLIVATGYVPDDQNFSDFCESIKSGRAWLISGTRGSGKTAFPEALASACNLSMCVVAGRDGLKQEEILYDWDREEQEVWMRENLTIAKSLPAEDRAAFLESARKKKWQKEFLILGEVGLAYELAARAADLITPPPVLLLDESDKFGASIEDSLLMPLERGLIYIPRFDGGFIGIPDRSLRPIVITTSNDLRNKLSSPFVSRHVFSSFATPSLEKELEILAARNPHASSSQLALSIKLLDAVRGIAGLEDHPSIRESIDMSSAFTRDSLCDLDTRTLRRYFCHFVKSASAQSLLKLQDDYLISSAIAYHPIVDDWLGARDPEWAGKWGLSLRAETCV